MKYYIASCINSNVELLEPMIDSAIEIDYKEFVSELDPEEFTQMSNNLGYGPWLEMRDDYHVSYWKSQYDNEPCVYVNHSAIEHIFV